jgi:hypothetical protein
MTRARLRIATASAALLVQFALVALFAHSVAPGMPHHAAREVMMLLPILHTALPQAVPPRVPRMIAPQAQAALPPMLDERAILAAAPPPSALEGIGRALFGCAPERFGQLTGPEQLRCPAPGQDAARMAATDLAPKSHSRDALLWAEGLAARQFAQPCEEGANTPGNTRVGRCVMGQTLAQSLRARQVKAEYDFERTRRGARTPEPIWVGLVPPKR